RRRIQGWANTGRHFLRIGFSITPILSNTYRVIRPICARSGLDAAYACACNDLQIESLPPGTIDQADPRVADEWLAYKLAVNDLLKAAKACDPQALDNFLYTNAENSAA
ncbi:MAG: hypothetical protein PHV02_19660, partial [Rhodocyclaceae bacterium]|nr:hypothetical protein [Rhodocyclaceae bacterium]